MRTALSWPVLRELAAGSYVDGVTRAIIHLGNNRAILDLIHLLLVPEQIDLALEQSKVSYLFILCNEILY